MNTYSAKPGEVAREWYVVDASGVELGRLATRIAVILRGKHKAAYTPHIDTGDFVVVLNASQVALSGNKLDDKLYYHYTGHKGGLKRAPARAVRERDPETMFQQAVGGMLPKNRLARHQLAKLKVYAGADHPHAAQQPKPLPSIW